MHAQARPDFLDDPVREALGTQILSATTFSKIHDARAALRAWMKAHPDDTGMLDGGEMLYILEDGYKTLAAEEAVMTEAERTETRARRRIEQQALSPSTLTEVEDAEQALCQWLQVHPQDEEMRRLFKSLALFREAYELLAEAPELTAVS